MIGGNLQKIRKEKRLTQEALAEMAGVTRQTVAKWESGDSAPDLESAARLASLLDVKLDDLVNAPPEEMEYAIRWLNNNGFESVFDDRLYSVENIAAGSDELRASIIQEYMDRDDIDAIWMARGGYGSIRIIDKLDFSRFIQHPKPIVGFSDVTVFHGKLSRLGIPSIHASMPHILSNKTPEALQSLIDALTGNPLHYEWSDRHCDERSEEAISK